MALIGKTYLAHRRSSCIFRTIVLKTAQRRPFLETKLAVERARRPETAQNLFVVMRLGSPIVMSHLDAGFEPRCGHKDVSIACCCLLLLKRVAQPWTLKGGVKRRQGKPSSVIKTRTRTELGPSLA